MLDVGHIPGVSAGDEVVVFGEQQGASLPVDVIASMIDTINYEVVSGIGARVPRMYIENVPG
jgi:alanine racemase